jgi:hypothetical protein
VDHLDAIALADEHLREARLRHHLGVDRDRDAPLRQVEAVEQVEDAEGAGVSDSPFSTYLTRGTLAESSPD